MKLIVLLTEIEKSIFLVLTDRPGVDTKIIRLIPNKTLESVNQALEGILREHHPVYNFADNGTEFSLVWEVFPEEHIYYAISYSSWEGNEYENCQSIDSEMVTKRTRMTLRKKSFLSKNWINNYLKNAWTTSPE